MRVCRDFFIRVCQDFTHITIHFIRVCRALFIGLVSLECVRTLQGGEDP